MADEKAHHLKDGDDRRAAIVHDLEIRLRPVCDYWPDDLFRSMVDDLADVTLKYEGIASPSIFDPLTRHRLVHDLRIPVGRRSVASADEQG
ncbi:MAG TPA: hypothetical protein VFT29_06275 [Gemmatimonadaceae bacterium]|nr:hypothetical protein [Gemmatimonadaceae bacterium]